MVVIEIEDTNGNTICAFQINTCESRLNKNGVSYDHEVKKTRNCEVADTDEDYIFKTDEELLRIQVDGPPIFE